ncbi:surface lipoprotein assembly modifier [Hoeflea sp.]|uniref:surface lipoprotein assembly modifier n=1 Tax=Hoeflea sp. TaxID=1940281 RepID=UPI003B025069
MRSHTYRLCSLLFAPALLALALFALVPLRPAAAGQPPPRSVSAGALIEAARAALAGGAPRDAAVLLEGVEPGAADPDTLDFLHGQIALARQDWRTAQRRFRAMLARDPGLTRVRLDLALAHYRAGEFERAERHFRLALSAPGLPGDVRANALSMLHLIGREKAEGWTFGVALALAPDSNINNATDAQKLGLFTLSQDARRTSGVGLVADMHGGYTATVRPGLQFRVNGGLRTRSYRESRFNERIAGLNAGPRFLFGRSVLHPEVHVRQRWIGGDVYSRSAGLRVSGSRTLSPVWRLRWSLGRAWTDYEGYLGRGHTDTAGFGIAHALGGVTVLRANAGWRRETLDKDYWSWREFSLGLSAESELPRGFVAGAGLRVDRRDYGAPRPLFGPQARRDTTYALWTTLSNRNIDIGGFTPQLTLRHERRDSNITLHDYRRNVIELGVVRSF